MYEKYKDQVEFLLVYIREAHATDGWQTPRNEREGVLLETAKSFEQKEDHATSCVRKLDIRFPTLIDNMDNTVESAYSAWPDRIYLVGRDGRIAFKGCVGPQGFKPWELELMIQNELQ